MLGFINFIFKYCIIKIQDFKKMLLEIISFDKQSAILQLVKLISDTIRIEDHQKSDLGYFHLALNLLKVIKIDRDQQSKVLYYYFIFVIFWIFIYTLLNCSILLISSYLTR